MKVKHQLELLYFQIDKNLMCMKIVSTFDIKVKLSKFQCKSILEKMKNQPI
jgi:hypothetical protein